MYFQHDKGYYSHQLNDVLVYLRYLCKWQFATAVPCWKLSSTMQHKAVCCFENWWKVQFWRLVRLIRCSNLDVMVGPPKSSPVADCWAQIWPVTQSLGWPAQPWRPGQRTPRQRSARERWGRSWWGGGQNLALTLPKTSYQLSGTPKIRVMVSRLNKERK